jgi:hypothetical protein
LISWGSIAYGAALSAAAAAALVAFALRQRRRRVLIAVALGAALGPILWNAILRDAGGAGFFVDAPAAVLPVSWQDTGSGVFAFAMTALLLGVGPLARTNAQRVIVMALVAGLGAFLVDVYLY